MTISMTVIGCVENDPEFIMHRAQSESLGQLWTNSDDMSQCLDGFFRACWEKVINHDYRTENILLESEHAAIMAGCPICRFYQREYHGDLYDENC